MTSNRPIHTPTLSLGLPSGWTWIRLDDICTGIFDCPHSTPELTTTGPYLARTQDISSGTFRRERAAHVSEDTYVRRTERATPSFGDLLYSREGTYFGVAAAVPGDTKVCLGQRMVLIRPNPKVADYRYVMYWLNSPLMAGHLIGYRDGSVAERLNLPTIRALPVLTPPIAQQGAIAEVLGVLDDKIEANRGMVSLLHALMMARFEELLSGSLNLETQRLSELASTQYGYTASSNSDPIGPRLLRVKDINKSPWINWDDVPYCVSPQDSRYNLEEGDLLVARMADPGKSALIDGPCDAVFASYLVRLKPLSLAWSIYLWCFLQSNAYRAYANSVVGGSVQRNMNARVIVGVDVPIPDEDSIEQFSDGAWELRHMGSQLLLETSKLQELRNALLPRLVSGKLRVRDAENLLSEPV